MLYQNFKTSVKNYNSGCRLKTWDETWDWPGPKTLILDEKLGVQCEGKDYPGKRSLGELSLGRPEGRLWKAVTKLCASMDLG